MSDLLRERIARALLKCGGWDVRVGDGTAEANEMADAVIAALGLVEETRTLDRLPGRTWRHYVTPWERIEEDG